MFARPAEWQFQITILERRSRRIAAADDRDCDGTLVSQRRDRAIEILKSGARNHARGPKRATNWRRKESMTATSRRNAPPMEVWPNRAVGCD
jgi:hypothetical protein